MQVETCFVQLIKNLQSFSAFKSVESAGASGSLPTAKRGDLVRSVNDFLLRRIISMGKHVAGRRTTSHSVLRSCAVVVGQGEVESSIGLHSARCRRRTSSSSCV